MKKAKHWYDYLWVYAIIYFALGFFNILFAWLGMIDFLLPLFLAIFGGNKFFCFHASAHTFTSMQPTGQSFAHLPQPTQRSASTAA